ncbi:MAG: hypothetical protein K2R93_08725 [Gemmatimonadaceae bacterium]|nr:hypothetical protein [Gemmatimonadaceae bacterium]
MRWAALSVPLMVSMTAGCFTAMPVVGEALPAGTEVLVKVTDAGRANLVATLGPGVDVVEGRLVSRDASAITVAASSVSLLSGVHQVWSGERIRIGADQVALLSKRQFSKRRTAIVTGAVLGVVFVVAKGSLSGLLQGSEGKTPSDSGASTRIPRP